LLQGKGKDLSFKAKAKDLTFKAKDLSFTAKDTKIVLKDSLRPRPWINITGWQWRWRRWL